MDHKDLDTNTDATPPEQANPDMALVARRRFLKGTTLALPAVMTLHSVAAQATAATSISCADTISQAICIPIKPTQDDFFRNKVPCYDKLTKSTATVRGKTVTTYTANGQATYFEGINCIDQTKCWRYVATGEIVPATEHELINCPTNVNAKPSPTTCVPINQQYAIVHFSCVDGSVMAVGEPRTPVGCMMTSLSGACLKSLWGRTI